jgi:hypothetical protein
VSDSFILSLCKSNGSVENLLSFAHAIDGSVVITSCDYLGNIIINTPLDYWNPVSGTEYEFEASWDLINNEFRLFIDGIQIGTTQTYGSPIDRTGSIDRIRLNAFPDGSRSGSFLYRDLEIFSNIQHTSSYTPGYEIPDTIVVVSPRINLLDIEANATSFYKHATLINISAGSAMVTGTLFGLRFKAGGMLRFIDGSTLVDRMILSVDSDTQITLTSEYPNAITNSPAWFNYNYGYFKEIDTIIQAKWRTGDMDFGETRVQKRLFNIFMTAISETDTELKCYIRKNKEYDTTLTAINFPIPSTASRWNEDVWNNQDITGDGGLRLVTAHFGRVLLVDTASLEITNEDDTDLLIPDFGLNYDHENRLIVNGN